MFELGLSYTETARRRNRERLLAIDAAHTTALLVAVAVHAQHAVAARPSCALHLGADAG